MFIINLFLSSACSHTIFTGSAFFVSLSRFELYLFCSAKLLLYDYHTKQVGMQKINGDFLLRLTIYIVSWGAVKMCLCFWEKNRASHDVQNRTSIDI